MKRFLAALLLGLTLASCNLDAAVFVDPSITMPTLTVQKVALGTTLAGGFNLELHLSARASGPSNVTVGSFSLRTANQQTVLVPNLPVTTHPASPIGVAENSTQTVEVAIDTMSATLDASAHDAICAGQVVVTGTITDSLETSPTSVTSAPFTPQCP